MNRAPSSRPRNKKPLKRKNYRVRTEAYAYQTLTPGTETKHLKPFLVTVDSQKEHKGVDYHHEGEAFIYVLDGKVEMMVGEERNVLGRGQNPHFNAAISHKLSIVGEKPAKFIAVIYTP